MKAALVYLVGAAVGAAVSLTLLIRIGLLPW
jgi:hypothetical protein